MLGLGRHIIYFKCHVFIFKFIFYFPELLIIVVNRPATASAVLHKAIIATSWTLVGRESFVIAHTAHSFAVFTRLVLLLMLTE
jgi:hypothetical protein